ncbi:MAG: hypothetical protein IID18_03575 [Nitrospinae bacterium]|nr:hypothetical protein [Nitrospinota bacterium]
MRPLHSPRFFVADAPQNDKVAHYCHAEPVEASRLPISLQVLCGFLLIFGVSQNVAQARTVTDRDGKNIKAHVDGFQSAQFGMSEKEVHRTIFKDFKIPESKIQRRTHPSEKTISFNVKVNNLFSASGPAQVFYIFGYKSQRLMQVNILWGRSATDQPDASQVVATANHLRDHFLGQGFKKKGMAVNAQLPDGSVLVFRGIDRQGRMVVLLLTNPQKEGQPPDQNISLRLSYIENPNFPDIFRIKDDDF